MPIPWHFKPNCTFISFFLTFCMIPCPILVALRHDTTCKFTFCILYASIVFYWFSSHVSFVLSICYSAAINVCAYCVECLLQQILFIAFDFFNHFNVDSKKKKKKKKKKCIKYYLLKYKKSVSIFFGSSMIEELISNNTFEQKSSI